MRLPAAAPLAVRVATVVVLVAAVVCQLVQRTDPTFALAYFTVCSALLLAVVLVVCEGRPGVVALELTRGAATVGVLVSALVYATVIAPASETGGWFAPHDDVPVRIATVLLHGVGPFLAVADFLLHPLGAGAVRSPGDRSVLRLRTAGLWLLWPASYLVGMVVVQVAGLGQVPYPFLQVDTAGDLPPALGAALVLLVAMVGIGLTLLAAHDRFGTGGAPTDGRRPAAVTRPG